MKRSQRNARLATTPTALASLHRPRIDSQDITAAEREYVLHWDGCPRCHTAEGAAGMCSLGRHLFSKLTRGDGDE